MISKLKGRIDTIGENYVIIDVQGVGYHALCSRKTLEHLRNEDEFVSLYTEMVVRQDLIQLYGFFDVYERDWFNLLTTVQGVGMKAGLAILSALSPQEVSQAIATQDKTMLTRAEGVGPKLATRIVNELKDKKVVADLSLPGESNVVSINQKPQAEEAVSALVNLGYRRQEALEAVRQACQNEETFPPVEEIIRQSLSKLARA